MNVETKVKDKIKLDIVSDVVCPWCIVGLRQLQIHNIQSSRTPVLLAADRFGASSSCRGSLEKISKP